MRKYWMTFRLGVANALHYRGNLAAGFATYAMFILVFSASGGTCTLRATCQR